MAMAYVPFAPSIPYYPPPPKPGQPSRLTAMNAGYYPPMSYPQRPPLPTGPSLPPLQTASSWAESQSCLFGASFPADLSAALPTGPQRTAVTSSLPQGDFSPLGALATGTDIPPSPSDTSSCSEAGLSPRPDFVHAVCNAPLVAPVPLPYHSPTFLQFDLPDDDEDLSHPPYVSRPHKRKRSEVEIEDPSDMVAPSAVKRRLGVPALTAHTTAMRHLSEGSALRYPLRRWPVQPGASHGTRMPG